jgi:hypothetical protein
VQDFRDAETNRTNFLLEVHELRDRLTALKGRIENSKDEPGDIADNALASSIARCHTFLEELESKLAAAKGKNWLWHMKKLGIASMLQDIERLKSSINLDLTG